MKNAMLIGMPSLAAVATAALILTGCDSSTSGFTSVNVNNPNGPASASNVNCTATANGSGGVTTACDNGVTVTSDATAVALTKGIAGAVGTAGLNGSNGAAGPTGSQGIQGPNGTTAPYAKLLDRNGIQVGTTVIGRTYVDGLGNWGQVQVWDSTDQTSANYNLADGSLEYETLYYQSTNCTGTAYAYQNIPANQTFVNEGVQYKTNGSSASFTPSSAIAGISGSCTSGNNGIITTSEFTSVSLYSSSELPKTLALPVKFSN